MSVATSLETTFPAQTLPPSWRYGLMIVATDRLVWWPLSHLVPKVQDPKMWPALPSRTCLGLADADCCQAAASAVNRRRLAGDWTSAGLPGGAPLSIWSRVGLSQGLRSVSKMQLC